MHVGIILAAGKGTRLNSASHNKTVLKLNNKPMVQYGVDLFRQTLDKVIVVVGAFAESVMSSITTPDVIFAQQTEQKGTGHAVKCAVEEVAHQNLSPTEAFVGYGDHLMFYPPDVIKQMLHIHQVHHNTITFVTVVHDQPDDLAWGRIIRNDAGRIVDIVEQKDATPEQRTIKESNAGLYCFDYAFLSQAINHLQPSPVTGEYYVTDLVKMAVNQGLRVASYPVPFELVGTGINTQEQLETTQGIMGT